MRVQIVFCHGADLGTVSISLSLVCLTGLLCDEMGTDNICHLKHLGGKVRLNVIKNNVNVIN